MKIFCLGLILTISLTFHSCIHSLYNVKSVNVPDCAKSTDSLSLVVYNVGKIGISNIELHTSDGFVDLGGVEPGGRTCPLKLKPFYQSPSYTIDIFRTNYSIRTINTSAIDHFGDTILTSGSYTLIVSIGVDGSEMVVDTFKIEKRGNSLD